MAIMKLPTSRLGRLARLAMFGTRASAGKLAEALGAEAKNGELAERAVEVLGTMRGLALKLGQAASYVDGLIPEEQREAFERTMKTLRDAAPTMDAAAAAR